MHKRVTVSGTSMATAIDDCSLSLTLTSIPIHTIMGNSGQGDQAVEVAAVHRHGQGGWGGSLISTKGVGVKWRTVPDNFSPIYTCNLYPLLTKLPTAEWGVSLKHTRNVSCEV